MKWNEIDNSSICVTRICITKNKNEFVSKIKKNSISFIAVDLLKIRKQMMCNVFKIWNIKICLENNLLLTNVYGMTKNSQDKKTNKIIYLLIIINIYAYLL